MELAEVTEVTPVMDVPQVVLTTGRMVDGLRKAGSFAIRSRGRHQGVVSLAERVSRRTEKFQIMLSDEELMAIDDWRFERRMPSRAAAIRALISRGLRMEKQSEEAVIPSKDRMSASG